jgi:CheY-like chemotaxis protein
VLVYLRDLPGLAGSVPGLLEVLGSRMGRAARRALLVDPSGLAAGFVDAPRRARGGGRRVLVVEGSPERAELLTALLSAAGHRVETAADGAGALRRLREAPFERMLLDLSGKGVSWKAVEQLRAEGGHLPLVVGLSAGAGLWEEVPLFRRGEARCLRKPWPVRDLLAAVAYPRAGELGVY